MAKTVATLATKATMDTSEFSAGMAGIEKKVADANNRIQQATKSAADAQVNFENRVQRAMENRVKRMELNGERDRVAREVNMRLFGEENVDRRSPSQLAAERAAVANRGVIDRLAQQNERVSKIMNIARGGAAVAGIAMVANAVENLSTKMVEMQTRVAAGTMSFAEMRRELAFAIPVVGQVAKAFDSVEQLFTGQSVKNAVQDRINANVIAGREALATATEQVNAYTTAMRKKTEAEERAQARARARVDMPAGMAEIYDHGNVTEDRMAAAKAEGEAAKTALQAKLKINQAEEDLKKIQAQRRELEEAALSKQIGMKKIVLEVLELGGSGVSLAARKVTEGNAKELDEELAGLEMAASKRLADTRAATAGGMAAIEKTTQDRLTAILAQGVADRNALVRKEATSALDRAKAAGQSVLGLARGLIASATQRQAKGQQEQQDAIKREESRLNDIASRIREEVMTAEERTKRSLEELESVRQQLTPEEYERRKKQLQEGRSASEMSEPKGLQAYDFNSVQERLLQGREGKSTAIAEGHKKATEQNSKMIADNTKMLAETARRLLGFNVSLSEYAFG